jgi:hypothetical protein
LKPENAFKVTLSQFQQTINAVCFNLNINWKKELTDALDVRATLMPYEKIRGRLNDFGEFFYTCFGPKTISASAYDDKVFRAYTSFWYHLKRSNKLRTRTDLNALIRKFGKFKLHKAQTIGVQQKGLVVLMVTHYNKGKGTKNKLFLDN